MSGQLSGYYRVSAKGRELYSFINALRRRGVRCFGQYCKEQVFYCQVSRKDLELLKVTADEFHMELNITELETLGMYMRRKSRRFGLIAGAAAVILASCYFSSVVVNIDIQGNFAVCTDDILAALDDIGIRRGTPFRNIDFQQSENRLRLLVGDIAWAGMHRTGHRLVVEVTEVNPKPDMLHDRIPCNVLASHDAEIVYTSALDGMLMRKVGDYVLAGDMLINGVTTDDTGHTVLHHAMGTIIGKYTDEVIFSSSYTVTEDAATGREYKRRILHLLSLDIPVFSGKDPFEHSAQQISVKPFSLFGNILPVSLETQTFTEYEHREVTLDKEQAAQRIMDKVFLYEKNFLSDTQILDRSITESEEKENSLTYTVKYTLQGDICENMEILIK